ncbi:MULTISPECIES: hypothetical protein [unclassified Bradyrhizobium]|uniref:hypothetical protein n=1 Tax=unclassified Bradyrhizobium TaxID=2631580 RepID=UPI0029166BCA|nr:MULTISPECIES: hypothetical protein [unclassified Bradyrhizobium]
MQRLTQTIIEHVKRSPKGTPGAATGMRHLGNRPVVQSLSRNVERGQSNRAGRCAYLLPVTGGLGTRAPSLEQAFADAVALGDNLASAPLVRS